MRIYWKLLVGFSLFGALVSLISGIAGGNPFGIILLRLVLSAVVFAALGLGVQAVFRRYLPDLLQRSPPPAQKTGEGVDIIIDEELPVSRAVAQEGDLEPEESTAEALGRESPEGEGLFSDSESLDSESLEMGEGPEEAFQPAELDGFEAEPTLARPTLARPTSPGSAGDVRETSATRSSFAAGGLGKAVEPGATDLELLPEFDDIDEAAGLASEPAAEEPESPERRPPSTPREIRQARIEETIRDQDPEHLARAVRTFLKKDQ